MPIRMSSTSPGMSAEDYDHVMADLTEPLRRSAGFISHSAVVSSDGTIVTEVWETREQWQRWFDTSVRPHLPPNAPEPTVTDLHNALGR